MEKKNYIYKITNVVNGKVYVGATVNFKRRIEGHKSKLHNSKHSNSRLQKDFKFYGWDKFFSEIITECDSFERDLLERFWIKALNSNNKEFGYNFESGGTKGKKLDKETCEKLREKTSSRKWIYGKHPQAKKVIRINDGKIFDSLKSAAESVGLTTGAIHALCKGLNNTTLSKDGINYQFAYYEEGKEYFLKDINIEKVKERKKIICLDTQEIFESMNEASRKMKLNQSKISLVCNGKRSSVGGLQFSFYEEGKQYFPKKLEKERFWTKKKVLCIENGMIYESTKHAAKELELQQGAVSLVCNGKRKATKGYTFKFIN